MISRGHKRSGEEVETLYSEEYESAKKEFVNCLWMSVIGLGVPVVLAFREWWPIMQREKKKALAAGQPSAAKQQRS